MEATIQKSAIEEINDLIEEHLDTLSPKEREKRVKAATQYVENLPVQPRAKKAQQPS